MNRVTLIGNLARDPEMRQAQSGANVCTFTLAVNRRFAGKDGQRECDFINVVCFKAIAENSAKYLGKGRKCAVHGSIQTRSYEGRDGNTRYVTEVLADEVEFLTPAGQGAPMGGAQMGDAYEDDLPF